MNEIWKEIEGFDGDYLISNLGNVCSNKFNKRIFLKQCIDGGGYYVVGLYKNNISKKFLVHRLVAENFIENKFKYPQVNHIDGNKTNNKVTNLEWVTPKQNIQHAWDNGLMENTRNATNIMKSLNKVPIYSKKLDMQFESCTEAATYIQTCYFENTKLEYLKTSISKLLNNKVTKSKFDFGWEIMIDLKIK